MLRSATSTESPSAQRQAGFTLVEILIAILIVGFVLGTAVLQVTNLYSTNRKNTSTQILQYLSKHA